MVVAARKLPPETAAAADIVEKFLVASMVPDPATAALYISPELKDHVYRRPEIFPPARNGGVQCQALQMGEEEDGALRRRRGSR